MGVCALPQRSIYYCKPTDLHVFHPDMWQEWLGCEANNQLQFYEGTDFLRHSYLTSTLRTLCFALIFCLFGVLCLFVCFNVLFGCCVLLWYEELEILKIMILRLPVSKDLWKGQAAKHPQKTEFPQHPNRIGKQTSQRESRSQAAQTECGDLLQCEGNGFNMCVSKWQPCKRTELFPENNFNQDVKIALP